LNKKLNAVALSTTQTREDNRNEEIENTFGLVGTKPDDGHAGSGCRL
jgi:hypothetical protein